MAKSRNNVVTHGLSGKVGDLLLFIQRFGKTYVGKIPVRTAALSEKQKLVHEKFTRAIAYAKASMKNAGLKAMYDAKAEGELTGFHFAFIDYFKAPIIDSVFTGGYTGTPGSIVEVEAHDDTRVSTVAVEIFAPNGSSIESGMASEDPESGKWVYQTTVSNSTLDNSKVKVSVTDLPGNIKTKEVLL